jgi:hypothetical protein
MKWLQESLIFHAMAKETQDHAQSEFSDRQYSVFLFFITFIVFALTSAHSVTFEDSGLFISAIKVLGLPQPPGYPLYIFLGHIFSYLPVSSLAFRIHLLSNLLGAGTAVLLFLSLRHLKLNKWSAFFSALAVATSSTFWSQMIVAEVYPLHIFIFSALFYVSLKILTASESKNNKILLNRLYILFGIILGLGLANHWPLLIIGMPLILAYTWSIKKEIFKNSLKWVGSAFVTAGLFYFLMMWRSQQSPVISFLGSIDSVSELFGYINRSYYRVIEGSWSSTYLDQFYFLADFVYGLIWREWFLIGILFLVGCYYAFKENSKIICFGLLFGVFATPIVLPILLPFEFNNLNSNVIKVFHLVSYFTAGLILPYGFEKIRKTVPKYFVSVSSIVLLISVGFNFYQNDLSADHFAEDYGRVILQIIPQSEKVRPLIAGIDADVGPLAYIRYGLGERTDLDLYTQSGVFFDNRLYDPWVFRRIVRVQKTKDFLQSNEVVYSTKNLEILNGVNHLPFSFQYNGILYEISAQPSELAPISAETLSLVKSALANYIKNPHAANWSYHREVIAARLCNLLIQYEQTGEPFEKIKSCIKIKALHLSKTKKFSEADVLLKDLIANSEGMISNERHLLRYHQLINRLEWINAEPHPIEVKYKGFSDAIEYAAPALDEHIECNNSVLTVIRSLEGRVTMSDHLISRLNQFKNCKKASSAK